MSFDDKKPTLCTTKISKFTTCVEADFCNDLYYSLEKVTYAKITKISF